MDNCGSSCILVGYSATHEIDVFSFYDTTTKQIRLDKKYVTWKGLKTSFIKSEEDDVDDPGEFGRDDKNDENFEIQPDVQPIIVEENPAVRAALRKI